MLNFSDLKLIDSSGIGVLVVCSAQIRQLGGMMRVAVPPGSVAHVLALVNIGQVVPIDPDLESACSNFPDSGGWGFISYCCQPHAMRLSAEPASQLGTTSLRQLAPKPDAARR